MCSTLILTEVQQFVLNKYLAIQTHFVLSLLQMYGTSLKAPFCLLMNPHWISIHQSCFISELEQAARMAFLPGLKKQINKVRSRSKWRFDFLKILLRENQSLKKEKKQWWIKKYMVSKYFHFQANQFMSERISGVEGTKLDDDFHRWGRPTKST